MPADLIISIDITLRAPAPVAPSLSEEEQMRCELWVTCDNPLCLTSGCRNALRHAGKEVRHEV